MVFRALSVVVIVACFYHLARRWWSVPTMWLVVVITLCSPLLLRSVFTDYPDAVYVPAGFAIITLLALRPASPLAAMAAGIAAALAVVSHPVAATIALTAFVGWLGIAQAWRCRVAFVGAFLAGCAGVLLGSVLWFRVRYGVDGLYTPTFEFLQDYGGTPDPFRSPRLLWLGYYLWVYLPAFVIGVALWLWRARGWIPTKPQRMILVTCGFQYAFQIFYEFAQEGTTLELVYYWDYMVPSLLLATAVVVGELASEVQGRGVVALTVGIVAALVVAPSPFPAAPSWLAVAVVVGCLCVLASRVVGRYPVLPLAVVSSVGIVIPLAAPNPLPLAPRELNVSADYRGVFKSTDSSGQDAFEATSWFVDNSTMLGEDVERNMHFWIGKGHGHRMAAAYAAHVSGRWLNAGWNPAPGEGMTINPSTWTLIETCQMPYLALVGAPDDIDIMRAQLRSHGVRTTTIFDGVAPSDDPTRADIVRVGPCPGG
jgi:4-amino-4-deoxy-L-arabinose transferase-like glycosyltransferase